jgi:hypothetical protein
LLLLEERTWISCSNTKCLGEYRPPKRFILEAYAVKLEGITGRKEMLSTD